VITIYGQIDPLLKGSFSFSNSASISDPQDNTLGNNTSSVSVTIDGSVKIYLPITMNRWPPIPDAPVLNGISNSDGDGNYTVIWNAAYLADTYTLQETIMQLSPAQCQCMIMATGRLGQRAARRAGRTITA
jgi:hypothetical protein